jgi:hypothetical protein
MKKLWMLLVSIVLCFVACDMPATGGNPGEGECSYIMKEHGIMTNFIRIICPFDSICDVKFSFGPVAVPDDYGCVAGFEYKFVQENEIKIVRKNYFHSELNQNTSVDLVLDSNKRASISLIDINNVEKKYDIDLSGIINSYTVRGDSVEVKSFECLNRMVIYRYRVAKNNGPHDIIDLYPDSLRNGKYVFYQDNLLFDEIYFNCSFGVQSSFKTDSVYIHGDLYWR